MKRLVYRPKVWAYVKAGGGKEPVDLSPYIVKGKISRVVNDVSTAQLIVRNPDFKFTENQTFKPMDPITIFMARDINHPVRAFTGFLDTSPHLQLFPGTIELTASCTLKRLKYTYWDPALPFSAYFMNQYGWQQQPDGSMTNLAKENERLFAKPVGDQIKVQRTASSVGKLNDSGLTSVLSGVMQAVGHWDTNDLLIEPLPADLTDNIEKLYNSYREERKDTQEAIRAFLKKVIGDPPQEVAGGVAAPTGQTDNSGPSGQSGVAPTLAAGAPDNVVKMLADCDAMVAARPDYVYGGNHQANPGNMTKSGNKYITDCSGFVSWALARNGMLSGATLSSGDFASWGKPGEGKYFTVWYNSGHVFMQWNGTGGKISVGTWQGSVAWHQHWTNGFLARHWSDET